MKQKIDYSFTHNDGDYKKALNYDGTNYYNNPITITVNNKLFIVGLGTKDSKTVKAIGNTVYIVGENTGLGYISMYAIDLDTNNVESCYLSENDLNNKDNICYGIFDKEIDEQVKILCNYLPY